MHERWFPFRTPRSAPTVRLACLAHAGGGASVFREWSKSLPAWIEVVPVQLPGHETRLREPLVGAVDELAGALADALAALPPLPLSLYGHSYGAVLAYATAHELERRGARIVRVFVAGGEAPHVPRTKPPAHEWSDDALVARLVGIGGTPGPLFDDPQLRELFLPVLRTDLRASETYRAGTGARLAAPLSVLSGTRDDAVERARELRWHELSSAPSRVHWFEGSHFFPRERRANLLDQIAEDLGADLRS